MVLNLLAYDVRIETTDSGVVRKHTYAQDLQCSYELMNDIKAY